MSIKPFAEQGHYTAVHDAIFDEVMPACPPNAWKVLCFIVRKTRGWQREEDSLPYRQIKEGSGINSDTTVSKALRWLVDNDLIVANALPTENGRWRATSYRLNRGYKLEYEDETTPETGDGPTPGSGARPTPENEVRPTPDSGDLNNHRVSQKPQSKNQSTSTEEDSLQSSSSVPESGKTEQSFVKKEKSPEDHTGKLIDDLEELGVYLDRNQVKAYSGNFGKLKSKGVTHPEIVRARQRIVSEWPRIQLSPQQAHSDLVAPAKPREDTALGRRNNGERRRSGGSAISLTQEDLAKPDLYAGRI